MRPERRFKPGMDGGLTAAVLISPPHHLRTAEILSKRWGPPHLRKDLELHFKEMRSVERNVAAAIGATWAWLATHSTPPLPKWPWLIPVLFVILGALRCYGLWKQFGDFHDYIQRIEEAFSGAGDPGGWEHYLGLGNTNLFQSTGSFWIVLSIATIAVALYEYS